jgi:hypothetical protein
MLQGRAASGPLVFIGRPLRNRLSMDACSDACDGEAGTLLADLERRQDDVLAQLDALDRQLTGLLQGLGVTLVDDAETVSSKQSIDSGDEVDPAEEVDAEPVCDERKRHEIRASTWDEPCWERGDGGSTAAAARFAASPNGPQGADDVDAAALGFSKLPHQETTAALRKPRNVSADAAAGRKRAA